MSEFSIPEIEFDKLQELAARIRPIFRNKHDQNKPYYMVLPDLCRAAFTWDPKPESRVTGLKKLVSINTLHTYGYYGFFKPSIEEVIAQIPEDLLDKVVAFETFGPDDVHDLNKQIEAVNAGFHLAETVLYVKDESNGIE